MTASEPDGAQEHFDTFMEWMRTGVRVHHHLLRPWFGAGRTRERLALFANFDQEVL